MESRETTCDELFASDAVADLRPVLPQPEETAALDQCFKTRQFEAEEKRGSAPGTSVRPPLQDYLRELQMEFQDQAERGKI
jgi:hypothetical protein